MRSRQIKVHYKEGDQRVVRKFLWVPRKFEVDRCGKEVIYEKRWLESADILEEYVLTGEEMLYWMEWQEIGFAKEGNCELEGMGS
ncbi:MAG: hypothetical protein GF334_02340 [Candidatus Altiarchaeales archaeon]|nr:hypothetical protein [Candidatus Altiarchaeales archaeon]